MSNNPLFSRDICWEGAERMFSAPVEIAATPLHEYPRMTKLPYWPDETIAVLCTLDEAPYAIPVTAPLRGSDGTILLALKDCRGSLARLRKCPRVALLILAAGDLAFTARGNAFVVAEALPGAPGFAVVAINVDEIDDHRLPGEAITSGPAIDWDYESTRRLLSAHLDALRGIAEGLNLKQTTSKSGFVDDAPLWS